jgi:hypothetical protein
VLCLKTSARRVPLTGSGRTLLYRFQLQTPTDISSHAHLHGKPSKPLTAETIDELNQYIQGRVADGSSPEDEIPTFATNTF